jgi:transposase
MAIREDRIGQSIFLNTADMVPKKHISRLVEAIVGEIDVSGIEEKFMHGPGNPAYPRRMLLRLLVMSAIDGIESSRKITKLAHENVIYIHLTGNMKPDFRTVCAFRAQNPRLVKDTFQKVVELANKLNMLDLGHLSTDGSIVKANASNRRSLSKEQIEWINEIVERGIQIDKEEDEKYGEYRGDELPPEMDTKEKILKKLREIEKSEGKKLGSAGRKLVERHVNGDAKKKAKVEKLIERASKEIGKSGQKAVSLTDPECRFMENKRKRSELSYNVQMTVDVASGVIVANDVVQAPTDCNQMIPQVEEAERNLGKLPEGTKFSLDGGYHNGENLRYLEERKFDGYIPNKGQAGEAKGKKRDKPYRKDKFIYDEERDCFICPQGQSLPKRSEFNYRGKMQYVYYNSAACSKCPARLECANNGRRAITSYGYEPEMKRMELKLDSPEGKAEYAKRKLVETPFGDIKENQGFRAFITRSFRNAKTEFDLQCSAHDIKRIWTEVGGDLKRIRAAMAELAGDAASKRADCPPLASTNPLARFLSLFRLN